jgi:hypothetical protein
LFQPIRLWFVFVGVAFKGINTNEITSNRKWRRQMMPELLDAQELEVGRLSPTPNCLPCVSDSFVLLEPPLASGHSL